MYHFKPTEQGLGEHLRTLLQLLGSCITDMSNVDKIQQSFVTMLKPKDEEDSRCVKEEAHTRLVVIKTILTNIVESRLTNEGVDHVG